MNRFLAYPLEGHWALESKIASSQPLPNQRLGVTAIDWFLRMFQHVSKPFFLEKPKRSWITMDSYDSGGEIEPFDFQGLGCTIVVRISLCFVTSRISTFGLYRFI